MLVGTLSCLARKNDINELVSRVCLVPEVGRAVEHSEDPRDLAEKADPAVQTFLKLFGRQFLGQREPGRIADHVPQEPLPPARYIGGECAYTVPEIAPLSLMWGPAGSIGSDGPGAAICRRLNLGTLGADGRHTINLLFLLSHRQLTLSPEAPVV